MKGVESFFEPVKIRDHFVDGKAEMSVGHHAFLCGLIKEKKPHKIVEVGVSSGGTTAVILECIHELGLVSEVYSVDISSNVYCNMKKKTGFIARQLIDQGELVEGNHHLLLGKYLPEFLPDIGKGIDFVILDTVHYLPGEVLDFIAILPFCSSNTVFVLHDIAMSLNISGNPDAISTAVLFAAAIGEKYIDNEYDYMDIGAFSVGNCQDPNIIENAFLCLMMRWYYWPGEKQLRIYDDFYREFYDEELCELFHQAMKKNRDVLGTLDGNDDALNDFFKLMSMSFNKIFLYGCGKRGKALLSYINETGLRQLFFDEMKFIVSDGIEKDSCLELDVISFSEYQDLVDGIIVLSADSEEIENALYDSQYKWTKLPESFWRIIEMRYDLTRAGR